MLQILPLGSGLPFWGGVSGSTCVPFHRDTGWFCFCPFQTPMGHFSLYLSATEISHKKQVLLSGFCGWLCKCRQASALMGGVLQGEFFMCVPGSC